MKLRSSTLGSRRRRRRAHGGLARRREIFLVQSTRERLQPSLLTRGASWLRRAGLWLIAAAEGPIKRTLDAVVAGAALVALSPILAVVALLIRRDGGPALYWQERVGRHGRAFLCPKFRSMVVNADAKKDALLALSHHGSSITFKMKNDPRVTPIGSFIRRTSIDELPQLWTVLTGDMSLVGPRPPVPREVAAYTLTDRQRLEVKPGLTCIWQVSGRGDIPFDKQLELDMEYIRRRSLRLDFELLFRTVPAVLSGRGAY